MALLALLAILAIGASAFLIRQLNAESGGMDAIRKNRNAVVLKRARQALIGYVAAQAAKAGENNPGAMPCPESPGNFNSTTGNDGKVGTSCGVTTVGRFPWRTLGLDQLVDASGEPLWYVVSAGWGVASGSNTSINSNSVGRLTLDGTATTPIASPGTVNISGHGFAVGDAVSFTTGGTLPTGITAGARYYVIASGLTSSAFEISTTAGGAAINFTGASSGPHNVHRNPSGAANSVVALIIAPGPAFTVPAAAGCAAWSQVRPQVPNVAPDWRNYLECENATSPVDGIFVTTGPSGSFNDQVLAVTVADVMPAIEAGIAWRIQQEIAPVFKAAYASVPAWGLSAATPLFPFAVTFADTSTSNFEGVGGTREGLLPMSRAAACVGVTLGCPPVNAGLVAWGSPVASKTGGTVGVWFNTCSLLPPLNPTSVQCNVITDNSGGTLSMSMSAKIDPFAAIRAVNAPVVAAAAATPLAGSSGFSTVTCDSAWAITSTGAQLSCAGTINTAGWACWVFCIGRTGTLIFPIPDAGGMFTDHPLTDPGDATTGWFVRNRWYDVAYYATAPNFLAGGIKSCSDAMSTCLSVTNLLPPVPEKRAILILAGRLLPSQALAGGTRPSTNLAHYLENTSNYDGDLTYTKTPLIPSVTPNDRFVVIDSN